MIQILRTESQNSDFVDLVRLLDNELAGRDGEDHAFYHQFNQIQNIRFAVVLYENKLPVAIGAIKPWDEKTMEVKRMFVLPDKRNLGYASRVLKELEIWAKEMGYDKCILETGKQQPEAIQLYLKNNYNIRPNYGQYVGVENSVCFEKVLQ